MIKIEAKSIEISIGANKTVSGTLDVEIAGYQAYGIVGVFPNVFGILPERFDVGQAGGKDVINYRFLNRATSTVNVKLWFNVMYIKN